VTSEVVHYDGFGAPIITFVDKKCWCGGRTEEDSEGGLRCLDSAYHDPLSTGDPKVIRKLYLAGPMSGYEENNYPQFNQVAETLRGAGYQVVNPAEFGQSKSHYVDLLRQDLVAMLGCDAVAIHGDWWLSSGARNEVHVAGLLRMPVRLYTEWLERAHEELNKEK